MRYEPANFDGIERFINKTSTSALATRYDELAVSYLAFIKQAVIRIRYPLMGLPPSFPSPARRWRRIAGAR